LVQQNIQWWMLEEIIWSVDSKMVVVNNTCNCCSEFSLIDDVRKVYVTVNENEDKRSYHFGRSRIYVKLYNQNKKHV
jgi:hypothetical protein